MSRKSRLKKTQKIKSFAILYILSVGIILANSGCSSDKDTGPDPDLEMTYDGNSTGLEHTVILSTLDTPMPKGKNVIWCSSFQLAWNQLKDNVIGEPVKLVSAEEIANHLNLAKQSSADIPDESCYAAAGFVKDGILEKIQTEMAKRFPSEPRPDFRDVLPIDVIIAYSYLAANVKFKIPYFENNKEFIFKDSQGNETPVTSFGIRPDDDYAYQKLRKQVEILCYSHSPESVDLMEFAVDLCKDTKSNQIVLAAIEPKETLEQTLSYLDDKIAGFTKEKFFHKFGINDVLLVPNIFWKITHHFKQLEGKYLDNRGYEGLYIRLALQMIQFRLDRSGAELKSEAKLYAAPVPRHFVFDQPFLIYMKKRGAEHPFFVMWVGNAELLSKQTAPGKD
ncbi:MAG: hypothetical protein ACYTDW_20545 [Planctomycetota bacterium]|jgi:hypothetical protein